jgi:hypothetical protein
MNFNLEICRNIPMLRLGKDYTTNRNGGYIRSFDVSNSDTYKKVPTEDGK